MRTLLLFLATSTVLGCSGLKTSPYRGEARYRSQTQGYSSPQNEPVREYNQLPRGPFELTWPVKRVKITRGFFRAKRPHQGIDFDGNRNDPILAAHEGHVIYTGSAFSGYGRMIIVQYDDTWASLYAHLNRISVREGDYVSKGEVLGKMGRTGRATGVHLHFELMKKKLPIDPLPLLTDGSRLVSR